MKAHENPFRTGQVLRVRYELEGISWPDLLARCQALRYRAAIIGPHGAGKTTLLEDLSSKLEAQGLRPVFLRLDEDQPRFLRRQLRPVIARLERRDIVLFDGAEQLPMPHWLWFRWQTRAAGGLIITTHRPGRLPTLWECRTSPDLLARIAAGLLGAPREVVQAQARTLYAKHRGNVRDALREWYDLAAAA